MAEEAAPATSDQPSTPTIDFDGVRYSSPDDLGLALSQDWEKATSYWRRRYRDVLTWVMDGLGDMGRGEGLQWIDDSDIPLDAQVFTFIHMLAPAAPLRFRNADLSPEYLLARGEAALAGDEGAKGDILAVYRQQIPALGRSLAHGQWLGDIADRWRELEPAYERQREALAGHGVDDAVPDLDDDVLLNLLVASLPGSSHTETLRQQARAASTDDVSQVRLVP